MSNMVSGEQYNPEMREQAELARRRDQQKNMTLELGGLLHDEWRSSRLQDNGSYEPRMKLLVQRGEKQKWINESDLQPNDQEILTEPVKDEDRKHILFAMQVYLKHQQ